MSFDMLALNPKVEQSFRVLLVNKEGLPLVDKEGVQAYVDVISADSVKGARAMDDLFDPRLKRRNAALLTMQDARAISAERCARLTVGWYLLYPNGEPIPDAPYSLELARAIYSSPGGQWIKKPVLEAIDNDANFI